MKHDENNATPPHSHNRLWQSRLRDYNNFQLMNSSSSNDLVDTITTTATFDNHNKDNSDNDNKFNHDTNKNDSNNNNNNENAKQKLSSGSGVIDVAGGSGHVSLALAYMGIPSTVIDPRVNVGRLPSRDRKIYNKALRKQQQQQEGEGQNKEQKQSFLTKDDSKEEDAGKMNNVKGNPPPVIHQKEPEDRNVISTLKATNIVPFSTRRAWFMTRPVGIDSYFREGKQSSITMNGHDDIGKDTTTEKHQATTTAEAAMNENNDDALVPICSPCSDNDDGDDLLSNCAAIIALHPDEATGTIVDYAIEHRIPFVVVPCCVFSRLFPNRYKPIVFRKGKMENEKGGGNNSKEHRREIVTTYHDLIDYLVAKDDEVWVTKLPFEGANLAIWSTF
mmetsp:Transcript_34180/g.50054  ORF Transcript_34180/g.50054 Transcript_34180/m.50054 type:complete len:390 (+) Transcript_34180:109-1278(+)